MRPVNLLARPALACKKWLHLFNGGAFKGPVQQASRTYVVAWGNADQPQLLSEDDGRSTQNATYEPFFCVGIDPDLNGSIFLLKCERELQRERTGFDDVGEGLEEWCIEGMRKIDTQCWDIPTYKYSLASGKMRRRVCGISVDGIINQIIGDSEVQAARDRHQLRVVIERPCPIPDVDGWQSGTVTAFTFGVIMGVLASKGLATVDHGCSTIHSPCSTDHLKGPETAGLPIHPDPLVVEVLAIQWKRKMFLKNGGKDASRELAIRLFPGARDTFKLKKHHGRAEAALLAVWGTLLGRGHVTTSGDTKHGTAAAESGGRFTFNECEQMQRLQDLAQRK